MSSRIEDVQSTGGTAVGVFTDATVETAARDARDRPAVRRARLAVADWLRRVHGWIGLWGAAIGLLFGASGLALDHRSGGPGAASEALEMQLVLPEAPATPRALGEWLQQQLALSRAPTRIRRERAQRVVWAQHDVEQPAHWIVSFSTPRENIQADWWLGNRFVSVHRSVNGPLRMIESLHHGTGLGTPWVLLADSLGAAMLLLSVSGVLMWMLTHRRRRVGVCIALGSLTLMLVLIARVVLPG